MLLFCILKPIEKRKKVLGYVGIQKYKKSLKSLLKANF